MTVPPLYQPLDPQSAPDPVTPADAPSDPAGYAGVTPHGQGPAPYNIQDPDDNLPDITAAYNAAGAAAGGGVVYPQSPRQAAAEAMLQSPAGFAVGGFSINDGFHAGGGDGWPADIKPGELQTPVQGAGSNQANTGTD